MRVLRTLYFISFHTSGGEGSKKHSRMKLRYRPAAEKGILKARTQYKSRHENLRPWPQSLRHGNASPRPAREPKRSKNDHIAPSQQLGSQFRPKRQVLRLKREGGGYCSYIRAWQHYGHGPLDGLRLASPRPKERTSDRPPTQGQRVDDRHSRGRDCQTAAVCLLKGGVWPLNIRKKRVVKYPAPGTTDQRPTSNIIASTRASAAYIA